MSRSSLSRVSRPLSLILAVAILSSSVIVVAFAAQDTPDASPEVTPVATPTDDRPSVTFNPVADAYVVQTTPDQNYGDRGTLISDQDLMTIAYIQFEVEDVEYGVEDATLRVWVTDPTKSAPVIWLSPPVALDEQGVTWNTRPPLDQVVEDKGGQRVTQGRWLEYDVSTVVSGDGIYVFAVVPTSTDGIDFVARGAAERQPELILRLADDRAEGIQPGSDDAAVLLAAGDIATCGEGAEKTAEILDDELGTIAALGDNAYNEGTAEQFDECYDPTWGRHKDRTRPVPGNHEYYTSGAEPYYEYFGEAAGEPGEGYYSYMLGEWKVIAINTNIQTKPDSDQIEWLRTELEGNTAQCTLVYGHHPRFSSGYHGSEEFMDPFFTLFYDYGVEIYLSGHEHSYERFRPQNPAGERDDEHGVRQLIVGTGGISLRPFEQIVANSEVRSADALGVMRFALYEDRYEFEFLAVEDATFYDSGEGACHDAPDQPWQGDEEGRLPDAYVSVDSRRGPGMIIKYQRVSM